jgi:hypothetical protein
MGIPYEFNAHSFSPARGSSGNLPVSPREGYLVQIVSVEKKLTNAAQNSDTDSSWYSEFTLQVVEPGPLKGKMGPYRLNLGNQSEQAANIAHSQLTTICYAVGKTQISDLSELQGIHFKVIVDLQASEEAQEKGWTEVVEVLCTDGSTPGQNSAPPSQAAGPPQQAAIEQGQPQQSQIAAEASHAAAGFAGPAEEPQQPQAGWGEQPQEQQKTAAPAETTPSGKPPWAE